MLSRGRYYAINTNGQSYRVFYLDPSGNTVFVTVYRWDANNNYIIFQSPCNCRIYLRRESFTLSTLSTINWFTFTQSDFPQPQPPSGTVTLEFFLSTSTWSIGSTTWTGSVSSSTFVGYTYNSITYDSSGVTVSATATFNVQYTKSFTYQWTNWITTSTPIPNLRIRFNSPISSIASRTIYTVWGSTQYNNELSFYYSNYYYRAGYPNPPSIHDSSNGVIVFTISASTSQSTAPSSMTNYVSITAVENTQTSTSTSKTWQKVNNMITASNGNVIVVYDSLTQLVHAQFFISASTYSYYLYTQNVTVSFTTTRDVSKAIVVPLNTSVFSQIVKSPNPSVFVADVGAWIPAYLINYGADESYLVVTPPQIANRNSLLLQLVYNYPVRYAAAALSYIYTRNTPELFPIQGTVYVYNTYVEIYGNISLGSFLGSTLVLRLMESNYNVRYAEHFTMDNERLVIYVNSTQSYISANPIRIRSILVLYNMVTERDYSYNVQNVQLRQWSMEKISYVVTGNIVGSWSYRIPVYITLSELPQLLTETGFVFRLELPVKEWITAGLLSPALEDLMIVDSAMKPCLFYIYRIRDDGKAVVFVRYDNTITSNTIVLYILLKNTQLWNSGKTFSTLATFDGVNIKDFVDDFGYSVYYTYLSYNAMLVTTSKNTNIKLGKTWFDFVSINNTHIYEQHGSTMFWNTTYTGFQEDDEILIYISRNTYNDVLVYRNARALISFTLNEYRVEPAYYVGYKDSKFVARFKMLMHSYAIGQIVGGFERPQQIVKNPYAQQQVQVKGVDWWSLIPMLIILIVIGVVVKLVSAPVSTGRGGVRLP